jgi:hypothetical protein
MVVGAAASSAAAAQGRYVISTDQIAATMSRMGMQVSPQQVTLLSDVVATKVSPILKVRSIERWDDQRMMARMECENTVECLPFFYGLRSVRRSWQALDGVMICDLADGVTWAVPEDINDGRLPTHQGDATHDGPCVANMHVGSWGWRRGCSMTTQILVQMEISWSHCLIPTYRRGGNDSGCRVWSTSTPTSYPSG